MRSGMNGDQKTTFQIFLECFLRDECRLIGKLPNLTKQKEHRRHGSISSPRSRPIISPQKISHLRITSSEHLCKPHTRYSLLSVTVCTKKLNTATSSANMMTARQKKQQSDQIIIGTTHNKIREEALKNSWDLPKLRKEGMQIESAAKGVNVLNNESPINKMGKCSYEKHEKATANRENTSMPLLRTRHQSICNRTFKTCRARTSKSNFCDTIGHYESVCRKKKAVKELTSITPESQPRSEEDVEEPGIYNINIFRVTHTNPHQPRHTSQRTKEDFKVQVIVNNSLATVLADTGASISVCGKKEAKRWTTAHPY